MVQQFIANGGLQAAGAIANFGSSLLGKKTTSAKEAAKMQYDYQTKLQQQAFDYNTMAYKNRYTWQMEDLKNAGLNPLYTMNSPSAPTVQAGAAGMPDMVGEQNNKRQMAMQGIQLMQSASALYYDNKLKDAQTKNKTLEGNLLVWEAVNKQLEAAYRKKELDTYDKRFITELEKLKSEIKNNLTGAIKNSAEAGSASALTNKIKAETEGIESTNEKLKRLKQLYKDNPNLAKMLLGAQEMGGGDITRILGIIGGGVSADDEDYRPTAGANAGFQKKVRGIIKQNQEARRHRSTSVRGRYGM